MKTMRKRNDEIYQLAEDQALVKSYKTKELGLFVYALRMKDADEACRSSEISVNLIIIIAFL
jgi:hypothetical protein